MPTWSAVATSTDAGGTADTFTDLGQIQLNSRAKRIVGIWGAAAPITTTAAEANLGQFRFDFQDQGKGRLLIGGPPSSGAATGTQSQGNKMEVFLLATDIKAGANQNVGCEFSTHTPDPTAGCAVVMGVMYSDGMVGPNFSKFWPNPAPMGGSDSEATADGSTVAETAITDIEIPAWARRVVGVHLDQNHDAAGANGEECVGFLRFRSSIAGFEPQEYPLPAISAPLAGTLAGTGIWSNTQMDHYWPLDFPTGGGNQTVTPNVVQVAAVSGGVAVSASVLYV